jgi:hypothetical protein
MCNRQKHALAPIMPLRYPKCTIDVRVGEQFTKHGRLTVYKGHRRLPSRLLQGAATGAFQVGSVTRIEDARRRSFQCPTPSVSQKVSQADQYQPPSDNSAALIV